MNTVRPRLAALLLTLAVAATLTAGEQRIFVRHADPAAMPTVGKLGQPVTFTLTNATLAELLSTVASTAGVAVLQAPELATLPVQQARFTISAQNVPMHLVLMEALRPFELGAVPTAEGVTVKQAVHMHLREPLRHESVVETADGENKKVEKRVVVIADHADAEAHAVAEARPLPPGAVERKVMFQARALAPAKFDENGRLHQELTTKTTDNGVESEGKLTLDIQK